MSDVLNLTRRQLLIGSLMATSAGLLSRLPDLLTVAATGKLEKLYVNTDCGLALSLGDTALDEARPWTWRMALAHEFEGDPDSPLSEVGLQHARERCDEYFGLGLDDGDFDEQAFQELLDEEHPDSGTDKLWGQYDEWAFRTASVARAYDLLDEILGDQPNLSAGVGEEAIPIDMEQNGEGKFIWLVYEQDIPRLPVQDLVFTTNGKTPISGFSRFKESLDLVTGVEKWRLHDIRRTMVSKMAELGVDHVVADKILAHKQGAIRGVARVYQRYEYGKESKAALDLWAGFVTSLSDD